jgi:hypothetical protein
VALTGWLSTAYLSSASAPASAAPLTLACFAKFSLFGSVKTLISLCNSGDTTNRFSLFAAAAAAAGFTASDGGGSSQATGTTVLATGTWYHYAAVAVSDSDRRICLDGVQEGTSAVSRTPSGINQTVIGARGGSSIANAASGGDIAEPAAWAAALNADELLALAHGVCPLLIRPASLIAYWPVVRLANINNRLAGHNLSATGTPTDSDHCRVLRPPPQRLVSLENGFGPLLAGRRNHIVGGGMAA